MADMLIDAKHLTYNHNFNEYVQELSTIKGKIDNSIEVGPMIPIPSRLILRNCPVPGQHREFVLSRVDRDGNSISGWFFIESEPVDGSRTIGVLLIND